MEVNSTDGESRGGGESPPGKYKVNVCDFCNHCLFLWSPECSLVCNISECIFRWNTEVCCISGILIASLWSSQASLCFSACEGEHCWLLLFCLMCGLLSWMFSPGWLLLTSWLSRPPFSLVSRPACPGNNPSPYWLVKLSGCPFPTLLSQPFSHDACWFPVFVSPCFCASTCVGFALIQPVFAAFVFFFPLLFAVLACWILGEIRSLYLQQRTLYGY